MSWMIADLKGTINDLEYTHKFTTYRSVLFPAPDLRSESHQRQTLVEGSKNIRLP